MLGTSRNSAKGCGGGHARAAATMWLVCAALFVVWMVVPAIDDELVRAEIGYAGAAALLCVLLRALYRR